MNNLVNTRILRTYRRRLTNLSSRNRSLLLTSLPAGQFLDLHETDFLLGKASFSIIAQLIGQRAAVLLCEVLDARQERSNEVSRKLRRIDRAARFIKEERGTEDLYVGWPFVRGKFGDGTVVHGPLLFFPVQIGQQGKCWQLTRRGSEGAFLNPTLALAYGQFSQVKLPDEVVEKSLDDFDKDPLAFRTQLYAWLNASPFDINFNTDLFIDQLRFFDKQTARSLDQLERIGELKLYPEAILGIFPQAGSFLVPDYDALIARQENRQENQADTSANDVSATVTYLPEKFIRTPLPLDASQEAAVRAVKAGESVVVQGPPGTGKSQLIANLMADAAASGKRVMLVCQKRAALDVVQARLRQAGMAPFMALIHDFQDDRPALYAQLAEQIGQVESHRQQNNSLNAVLIERDFELESHRIDQALAQLTTFKEALFDTQACGLSAKELYLTSNPDGPTMDLHDSYSIFHFSTVDSFIGNLADYARYRQRLGPAHPWATRVDFAGFTRADMAKIDTVITDWAALARVSAERLTAVLGGALSLAELSEWLAQDRELTLLPTLLDAPDASLLWQTSQFLQHNPAHPAATIPEAKIEALASAWDEALAAPGPEPSLQASERPAFQGLLSSALAARSSWVGWQWWQLTRSDKARLEQVASANGLTLSKPDLQALATKVDQQIRIEAIWKQAEPLLAGLAIPNTAASLRLMSRAQRLLERINALAPLRRLPAMRLISHSQFITAAATVLTTATTVQAWQAACQPYLTADQFEQLWQNDGYAQTLRDTLRQDVDLLIDADQLMARFSDAERTVIERLGTVEPPAWADTFQNTLRLSWLDHIEQKHPSLRSVSSLRMAQLEETLQQGVEKKQALSRDILLVKLREQTYKNLNFNRLNNTVTYRELRHQTTKKRHIWPIRKLLDVFADEVFRLIPCWLASPESVSAMFPLRSGLFDLVIFDEASQCFAENGIPAMARGKQLVVTGDNQQLRPSDLYRTRVDEPEPGEEIPTELEVESLLELAAQHLPQLWLTAHYRSRSSALIAFSNGHFYQNKLVLLPYFADINRYASGSAIQYLNVGGTWQNNTNATEAEAILQLLDQIATDLPGRSVGIVTFNYPQQQLIQDMLENQPVASREIVDMPAEGTERLFVKNIENVQGDERDVIIFSVGYAPNAQGQVARQFGSLNTNGGANRLNVAITRARERIYVVTSLQPNQLRVGGTVNEGPALLKAYLAYALDVSQGYSRATLPPGAGLPARSSLKNRLAVQHSNWQPELPFADLTVKTDSTYESLIMTDDDLYYHQTPKQAHAYLPLALRARQWPFRRIWSRSFWQKQG